MYDKEPFFENQEEFHNFMQEQKNEIDKYKWIESEKLGYDIGLQGVFDWVAKYSKEFFENYIEKNRGKK